jgi:hypothetical protein
MRIDVTESRTEAVLAAWAGIVGFALSVVGGLIAGEFDTAIGGTRSDIVDAYQGATFDTQYVAGVILETLGFLLLMAFVLKLGHVLAGRRDMRGWLGTVIGASVVVSTVLTLVAVASRAAAIHRASNGGFAGDGYVVLADMALTAYLVSLPVWGLILLTGGTLVVRTQSFPLWLGWTALPMGGFLVVVPFIDAVDVWDAATGLAVLWFLAIAVYMLTRSNRFAGPASEESRSGDF